MPGGTRPFVFLNACGTAEQGDAYEPPSFPGEWITGRGALAVVATLCPVPDYFAHAFALKFYELLLPTPADADSDRPRSPAHALLATRRHFLERYNNPLGLAYVLYAERGAYLTVGTRAAAGAP